MTTPAILDIRPEIETALKESRPIVALESTLISHGLPWPVNLETAQAAEKVIREVGVVPATIAVLRGRPTIGINDSELEKLALGEGIHKASRRDLGAAIAMGRTAATTVAATMFLAHQAGIRVIATGGIGGAHPPPANAWDISADLLELARTPVAVVCSGAKTIVDIPRTMEILETISVPVIGFATDNFPAFYVRSSGLTVNCRVNSPEEAAQVCKSHWKLGGAGLVIAQPAPAEFTLDAGELDNVISEAEKQALKSNVRGPELTPFLLKLMANLTGGKTLKANQALVLENARLAARMVNFLG
jgi:pseudouridine-5'-phosphate glycosidase